MIKIATVVGAKPQCIKAAAVSCVIRSGLHATVDVMSLPMDAEFVVCDQAFVTRTLAEILVPVDQ
jgi:UDP-N-acetylglucosamine 2-epimerase